MIYCYLVLISSLIIATNKQAETHIIEEMIIEDRIEPRGGVFYFVNQACSFTAY